MQADAKHSSSDASAANTGVNELALPLVASAAAAAVGLVALPTLLTADQAGIWFVAAIVCSLVVLVALPSVTAPLAAALGRLPHRTVAANEMLLLARLFIVLVELVLLQGILRRPVSVILASNQPTASAVEAGIAAGALSLLLVLLVWTYQTGRRLLSAVAWSALDAIPTVSAPAQARPTMADTPTTASNTPHGAATLPVNATLPSQR